MTPLPSAAREPRTAKQLPVILAWGGNRATHTASEVLSPYADSRIVSPIPATVVSSCAHIDKQLGVTYSAHDIPDGPQVWAPYRMRTRWHGVAVAMNTTANK